MVGVWSRSDGGGIGCGFVYGDLFYGEVESIDE